MEPFNAERYVQSAAPRVGVELTPTECRDVAVQLERIQTFAQLVLELDIGTPYALPPAFEP